MYAAPTLEHHFLRPGRAAQLGRDQQRFRNRNTAAMSQAPARNLQI